MKEKNKLDFGTLLALVIGSVIGIGIFFKFRGVLKETGGDTGLAIITWIAGGIISISAALTVAEIASMIKGNGGVSKMITKIYGKQAGFLSGWIQIAYIVLIITAIAYYTSLFAISAVVSDPTSIGLPVYILLAFALVGIAFGSNMVSKTAGAWVQKIATVIKVIPLVLVIVLGFVKILTSGGSTPQGAGIAITTSENSAALIAAALIPVLFTFDGWIFSTSVAGEVENPGKTMPKAIIVGLSTVTLIYVGINIALLATVPKETLIEGGVAGAAQFLTGSETLAKFVSVCIAVSAYGILNGYGLLSQRFIAGLAEDKNFFSPEFFAKKNEKDFPINSGLTMLGLVLTSMIVVAALMTLSNDSVAVKVVDVIADKTSNIPTVIMWAVYLFIFIGWFILRQNKPKEERMFKLKGALLAAPVIAVLSTIYILSQQIIVQNKETGNKHISEYVWIALVIVASGLLAYNLGGISKYKNEE